MTRTAAERWLRAYFAHVGQPKIALNERGIASMSIGLVPVSFVLEAKGEVAVYALVYRFRSPAREALIQHLSRFAALGQVEMAGGALRYLPTSQAFFLVRSYSKTTPVKDFAVDVARLANAAAKWAAEGLAKAMSTKLPAAPPAPRKSAPRVSAPRPPAPKTPAPRPSAPRSSAARGPGSKKKSKK